MKKLFIVFVTILFVSFTKAQTVDEVIAKHITAIGGKEKLEKITNVVFEGSMTVQGAKLTIVRTTVQNKLDRQDISAGGMKAFDFTSDKDGWSFMPFQGMQKPEPKTAEALKEGQSDLDIAGQLFNYAAKGSKAELLGKEDVEGTECLKIKLTLAGGKDVTYFIEPETYMIVRRKEISKADGKEMEIITDYSDYKEVEGVKFAHSVTMFFGTLVMNTVKVNQVIDEKLYNH